MVLVYLFKLNSKTYLNMSEASLRESYGTVILPKGTILYYISDHEIDNIPNEAVLITTLHPSGLRLDRIHRKYVSNIELQKDVSLFFMINSINSFFFIYSALTSFSKFYYQQELISHLEKENFEGWFSSRRREDTNEIAIFNKENLNLFKFINCEPVIYDWSNRFPKNWGTLYPISTTKIPIKFIINIRFKPILENYLTNMLESKLDDTILYKILNNSIIEYIDVPFYNPQWICDLNEKAHKTITDFIRELPNEEIRVILSTHNKKYC